jgi:hypothetical protein
MREGAVMIPKRRWTGIQKLVRVKIVRPRNRSRGSKHFESPWTCQQLCRNHHNRLQIVRYAPLCQLRSVCFMLNE